MPRIRSIKPEMPQSESMGRVSRDARLLFIQLWTLCDDEGRTRGNSRMLASLLYPYDEDARKLIDPWMAELEREKCVQRYEDDGHAFLQVCNWQSHQKIDRPSRSKIPPPPDTDSIPTREPLANVREDAPKAREDSSEDQGRDLRIKEGKGSKDRKPREASPTAPDDVDPKVWADWLKVRKEKKVAFTDTAIEEVRAEAKKAHLSFEAALRMCCQRGWAGFEAKWLAGGKPNGSHKPAVEERNQQHGEEWLRRHKPKEREPEIFDAIATERKD